MKGTVVSNQLSAVSAWREWQRTQWEARGLRGFDGSPSEPASEGLYFGFDLSSPGNRSVQHCNVAGCTNLAWNGERCEKCRAELEALERMARERAERRARRRRAFEQALLFLLEAWEQIKRVDWVTVALAVFVLMAFSYMGFVYGAAVFEWLGQ